jgi:hypothetical protein
MWSPIRACPVAIDALPLPDQVSLEGLPALESGKRDLGRCSSVLALE